MSNLFRGVESNHEENLTCIECGKKKKYPHAHSVFCADCLEIIKKQNNEIKKAGGKVVFF